MELIFLGTSSGTPTRYRNVPATALRMKNNKDWYLVDCGEGTQHQFLILKMKPYQIIPAIYFWLMILMYIAWINKGTYLY